VTPPVVLLHGFTGSPDSWQDVIRILETRREPIRVHAPALLGHDGTPGPPELRGFEDEVDRVAAGIRARALHGSHLVGYSLGARVALGLLVRHQELVSAATLIGGRPGLSDPADRRARTRQDEEWARLLDEKGLDTFVAAWEALPIWATQAALPDRRLERQRAIRRAHDPRGLARSLRVAGLGRMPYYGDRLGGVNVGVRLVVGDRDTRFLDIADRMAEQLPRATLIRVSGAGHNVVLERPREIAALLQKDRSP
jgi:2-succinyl-6-hydroxy-2,4-cyclohexadiene-1-carboxylate synthase